MNQFSPFYIILLKNHDKLSESVYVNIRKYKITLKIQMNVFLLIKSNYLYLTRFRK